MLKKAEAVKCQTYPNMAMGNQKKRGKNETMLHTSNTIQCKWRVAFWPILGAPSYRVSGRSWSAPGRFWSSGSPVWWSIAQGLGSCLESGHEMAVYPPKSSKSINHVVCSLAKHRLWSQSYRETVKPVLIPSFATDNDSSTPDWSLWVVPFSQRFLCGGIITPPYLAVHPRHRKWVTNDYVILLYPSHVCIINIYIYIIVYMLI